MPTTTTTTTTTTTAPATSHNGNEISHDADPLTNESTGPVVVPCARPRPSEANCDSTDGPATTQDLVAESKADLTNISESDCSELGCGIGFDSEDDDDDSDDDNDDDNNDHGSLWPNTRSAMDSSSTTAATLVSHDPCLETPGSKDTQDEVIKQFYVDAPRMAFFVNATPYTKSAAHIHRRLVQFCNRHMLRADYILLWCTQISLAPIFKEKRNQITSEDAHHHLLDNGRHRVTIDDHSGALHIVKPFRVDREDPQLGQMETIQCLTLHVTVRRTLKPIVDWIEYQPPRELQFVETVGKVGVVCALAMAYIFVSR